MKFATKIFPLLATIIYRIVSYLVDAVMSIKSIDLLNGLPKFQTPSFSIPYEITN